ncbi:MAG: T9SS type A sorting domain-containing protein [Flavobacteriales bacterium]|nr:T9SS type A sorting domain-containing protein [Flavobacteriales bacterium]
MGCRKLAYYGKTPDERGVRGSLKVVWKKIQRDLGIGIWAQGQGSFNSNAGLQIKCNDFINDVNFFDILNITGDIGDPQGQCITGDETSPAGNTFSHTCNTLNGSNDAFANTNTFFKYNHHNDSLRTPECFSGTEINADECPIGYLNKQTSCPSQFTITGNPCGFGPFVCKTVLADLNNSLGVLNTVFDSLLDGGSTAGLLATVATQSSGKVKNALMAVSPHVSDTVLLAYLSKPTKGKNHVSPGHVKEVIVANSPVTKRVKDATDNKNLPLGIQKQIDAAQIGTSPRRELELEIAFFEGQLSLKLNSVSRFFLHDSLTTSGIDSVIDILKSQDRIDRELQLIEAYIEAERLTEAKLQLDLLDLTGGLENFCKLQHIVISIIEDSASFDTLLTDTLLQLAVDSIANDTLQHGYLQARAILSMVFGTRFIEHIEPLPQQVQLKTSEGDEDATTDGTYAEEEEPRQTLSQEMEINSWVNIYPNPAKDKLIIEYSLPENAGSGMVEVHTILGYRSINYTLPGKQGTVIKDITNLPGGVYFFTIMVNNTAVAREKIIIVK